MMQDKSDRHRELETVAVLAAACLFFDLFFRTRWLAHAALALLLTGLFVQGVAAWISRAWWKFATFLGGVNAKVLLGLVYLLVLTPIALVYRALHGDFLVLKRRRGAGASYWTERNHRYEAGDLDRPW